MEVMLVRNKNKFQQGGFTLIELLIVIAIIGILSSIVLVSLNSARGKARDAKRKQELSQIKSALDIYAVNSGQYPSEAACDSSRGSCGTCPCSGNDWNYTTTSYIGLSLKNALGIQNLPKDPLNDASHYYWYEPDCNQGLCTDKGCCGYQIGVTLESGGTFSLKGGY